MWLDLMSNSAGDAVIAFFHLFISFILLSFIVSFSFIFVIRSSLGQRIYVSSLSASKERKHEGDRPGNYNDDKRTDRLYLIDFSEDLQNVLCRRQKWKDQSYKENIEFIVISDT